MNCWTCLGALSTKNSILIVPTSVVMTASSRDGSSWVDCWARAVEGKIDHHKMPIKTNVVTGRSEFFRRPLLTNCWLRLFTKVPSWRFMSKQLILLYRDECGMVFRENKAPISSDCTYAEACPSQRRRHVLHFEETLTMNLVKSSIVTSGFPEGNNSSSQKRSLAIFIFFHENDPILALGESFSATAGLDLSGFCYVEYKKAARPERLVHPPKEAL